MAKSGGLPLWPILAAAVVAVVGVLVAVLWPNPPASLRADNPNHNAAGDGVNDTTAGVPYAFATYPLCVVHGSVTVTGVRLRDPRGLRIVDWAVGPDDGTITDIEAQRERAGAIDGYRNRPITRPCTTDPNNPLGQGFAVSVRRTAEVGSASGFEVHSTSGTAVIPFSVALCAKKCPKGIRYSGTP